MYLSSISSRLLLHDVHSWDLKQSYSDNDGIIRDHSWSDDGKYILQVNPVGVVNILTATEQEAKSLQHVPIRHSWSATFHRDGHRNIAVGTKTGSVYIWDTKNKSVIKSFTQNSNEEWCVNFVSYNLKNTNVAATMENGKTVIYALVSNVPVLTFELSCSKSISAMKFHPESQSQLGLATDEGHIVLRNVATDKEIAFFKNVHASPVSDFTFTQFNKDVLLSSGYDKIMHVYDIRLHKVLSTIRTNYTLTSIATNTEYNVALGTKNGLILLYDLRDMGSPFKVLDGHKEEVSSLAFQPARKKSVSTELSLREDVVATPVLKRSPTKNSRVSDMFMINDSLPQHSSDLPGDSRMDSFLAMMGLDKSGDFNEDTCTSQIVDKKCDNGFGYSLEVEKNLSKVSTPINEKNLAQLTLPSPMNVTIEPNRSENIEKGDSECIDVKAMEDLKQFIKLSLSEVADDNRSYFFKTMMMLTKQKLFLEQKLAFMSDEMQSLVQNQNALVETNRKLALEIDKLKMAQQYPL